MMNFKKSILLVSLSFLGSMLSAQDITLKLINNLAVDREDELIVLKREFLEKKFKESISSGISITEGSQPVFVQFDDLDGDGLWDEAVFMMNFLPSERKNIVVSTDVERSAQIKPVRRAYVRQKRKLADGTFGVNLDRDSVPANQANTDFRVHKLPSMLTEGPAWENDRVGFRFYMDVRNQKDIWGKRTSDMVLDYVGTNPENSYHKLNDWGMDILIVGKSLAAGALALNFPLPDRDTLVRLGGENMGPIVYEKVSDGPLRAIFRMHYPEWNVLGDGNTVSLTEEIHIWAGQYFYESKVLLKGVPKNAQLVTGIVALSSRQSYQLADKKVAVIYSYDIQTDNKDKLGLAVSVPKKELVKVGNIGDSGIDIKNSYTIFQKLKNNTAQFRFYAGWELSHDGFKTLDGFRKYMERAVKAQQDPIKVK